MNLQQIIAEVKRYGFGDLEYDETAITGVINAAYGDVQKAGAFPFTEAGPITIPVNVPFPPVEKFHKIPLPDDFNKVRAVTEGYNKLRYLDPDDFIQMSITHHGQGQREYSHYTVWDGHLLIWPMPYIENLDPVNLNLWYHRTLKPLGPNNSTPEFPERYHYLLVYGALKRLYGATDEDDKLATYTQLWNELIEQLKEDIAIVEFDRTEVIGHTYTLASISKMVREHGFSDIGNSQIELFANQTIREICSQFNWPFLEKGPETITLDSESIELPKDCAKPRRIVIDTGGSRTVLENKMIEGVWDRIESSDDVGSTPEFYSAWGMENGRNTIRLWPKPDRAYQGTIWYLSHPGEMVTVTDTPPFPAQHHGVVLYGVLYKCALASTEEALIAKLPAYRDEFNVRLEEMVNDLMTPTMDKPFVIEGPEY